MAEEKEAKPAPDGGPAASAPKEPAPVPDDDADALESTDKSADTAADEKAAAKEVKKENFIKRFITNVNPYLLVFAVIIIVGIVVIVVASRVNRDTGRAAVEIEGQELDQGAIDELVAAESNIGTVDQTITIGANAIFEGKILVKDSLDVAGSINVGGPLSLPSITVAGDGTFRDIDVSNNISIGGSANIQQALTVEGGATINGGLSVGGTISAAAISADSVQFTGDLQLTRHIDTGGGTPGISRSNAVGGGGTVSISGNDVSGTVTINTGSSPPAGIFASISFRSAYNSTPRVQLTPSNSAASTINYYVTRNSSGFSVGSTSVPSASTTYTYDYFITE